jgi:hypothetical protein
MLRVHADPPASVYLFYLFYNFILSEGRGCQELYTQGVCHMEASGT